MFYNSENKEKSCETLIRHKHFDKFWKVKGLAKIIYTRKRENSPHKDNPDAKRESLSTFTSFESTLKTFIARVRQLAVALLIIC